MENRDLAYFKQQASARELCRDFALFWAKCGNNYSKLFELAMSGDAILYVATSIYEGWGISYEYIYKEFNDYINNETPFYYVNSDDLEGITFQWKLQENNLRDTLNANVTHLCNCKGCTYNVGTDIAELYITNDSDVILNFTENCRFSIYLLNNAKVTLNNLGGASKITVYNYNADSNDNVIKGEDSEGVISIKRKTYNYKNGR